MSSEKDEVAFDERAHELAVKIYVALIAKHTEVTQDSVKMAASPANIAGLSLKLSEAFLKAEADAIAAKAPVVNFTLKDDAVAQWLK